MSNFFRNRRKTKEYNYSYLTNIYTLDTINIPHKIPVLFDEIIFNDYVSKKKADSRIDFINKAIEEKFQRDGVNYFPAEFDREAWEKEVEDLK